MKNNDKKDIKSQKMKFLQDEFFANSIQAAFRTRGRKVYNESTNGDEREEMKDELRKKLFSITDSIKTDEDVFKVINEIQSISKKYFNILNGNKLRIGVCQKLLNTFLKYMWTANLIEKPPHCPFDGIVLNEINNGEKTKLPNWTEMDDIDDYKKYVSTLKSVISKQENDDDRELSLAEWELAFWNERNDP